MAGSVACTRKSVAVTWGRAEMPLFSRTGLRARPKTCAVSARTARSPEQRGQDTGQRASRVISGGQAFMPARGAVNIPSGISKLLLDNFKK